MLRRYANVESLKALRSVSSHVRWKLDTLPKEIYSVLNINIGQNDIRRSYPKVSN